MNNLTIVVTVIALVSLVLALMLAAFAGNLLRERRELRRVLGELHLRFSGKEQELETVYKKSKDYFNVITTAQRERDNWNRLYNQSVLAAGNFQEHFMVERERNFRLMHDAGIQSFRDRAIDQLVGAFREQHHVPVKESIEKHKSQGHG